MNILVRLFLIPVGYLAAIFAAASLIALISWLRAYAPVADDPVALSATTFIILTDWVFLFILFMLLVERFVLVRLERYLFRWRIEDQP